MTNDEILNGLKRMFCSDSVFTVAKVISVNTEMQTCKVEINGNELSDVRLSATIDGIADGVFLVPAVGSFVIVCFLNKNKTDAIVIQYSAVEEIVFHEGKNAGIVKVKELTNRLNAIEKAFNELLNFVKSHTHTSGGSGSPTTSPVPILSQSGLVETKQSDIENEKIKH